MASEASKIRNQCAKKYGVREKAYKDRITALETEISSLRDTLQDYDNMKREYMKLVLFCGLDDDSRRRVLQSEELRQMVEKYARLYGVATSKELKEFMVQVLKASGTSLSDAHSALGLGKV